MAELRKRQGQESVTSNPETNGFLQTAPARSSSKRQVFSAEKFPSPKPEETLPKVSRGRSKRKGLVGPSAASMPESIWPWLQSASPAQFAKQKTNDLSKKAAIRVLNSGSAPWGLGSTQEEAPRGPGKSTVHHANRDLSLRVLTWNIAAPNTNPFEYWATHDDPEYTSLMAAVQNVLDHPERHDMEISMIFTHAMFEDLKEEMKLTDVGQTRLLDEMWTSNFSNRKAITGFLKDTALGEKRLISMPDRMTGSLKSEQGLAIFRPTPVSGCQEEMGDIPTWWSVWKRFMFHTAINVRGAILPSVFSILSRIPRSKYPALTEEEEVVSIALQALCLAIFDSLLIFLLSGLSRSWQQLKWSLHKALFENKEASCVNIFQKSYSSVDVFFIQEASEKFAAKVWACLQFFVLRPRTDGRRSQTSIIMLKLSRFMESSARDVTDEVLERLESKCVERGDLCVFEALARDGSPFLFASFHGDSGGLATCPVLSAVHALAKAEYPGHVLICGLDANTAGRRTAETRLDVDGFMAFLDGKDMVSCWHRVKEEDDRGLEDIWTTFSARTYIQPQLHKAVGHGEVLDKRNMNLKDWIVFSGAQLKCDTVERDNTGRCYFEHMVIPSQTFPSDHAIVLATLSPLPGAGPAAFHELVGSFTRATSALELVPSWKQSDTAALPRSYSNPQIRPHFPWIRKNCFPWISRNQDIFDLEQRVQEESFLRQQFLRLARGEGCDHDDRLRAAAAAHPSLELEWAILSPQPLTAVMRTRAGVIAASLVAFARLIPALTAAVDLWAASGDAAAVACWNSEAQKPAGISIRRLECELCLELVNAVGIYAVVLAGLRSRADGERRSSEIRLSVLLLVKGLVFGFFALSDKWGQGVGLHGGRPASGPAWCIVSAFFSWICSSLLFMDEALLFQVMLIYGGLEGLFSSVQLLGLQELVPRNSSGINAALMGLEASAMAIIGLFLMVCRWWMRANMVGDEKRERQNMTTVWEMHLKSDKTAAAGLAKIHRCREEYERRLNPDEGMHSMPTIHSTICQLNAGGVPIQSLDQLYAQAQGVKLVLWPKVQQWASLSRGFLIVESSSSDGSHPVCVRGEELGIDRPLAFTKIKSVERAIDKVLTFYQADVSRLIDLCRQTLVFDSVEDLANCFQLILNDGDLMVERIESRLDGDCTFFGHRDVKMHVRISTYQTQRLGIDKHICELRLALKEFALRKLEEKNHSKYIRFKKYRAVAALESEDATREAKLQSSLDVPALPQEAAHSTHSFDFTTSCPRLPDVFLVQYLKSTLSRVQSVQHLLNFWLFSRGPSGKTTIKAGSVTFDAVLGSVLFRFSAILRSFLHLHLLLSALNLGSGVFIPQYKSYRFTMLEVRNHSIAPVPGNAVQDFGFTLGGCPIKHPAPSISFAGKSMILTIAKAPKADGWYFRQLPGVDITRFTLDAARYGSAWQRIGASAVFTTLDGDLRFREGPHRKSFENLDDLYLFNFGAPWQIRAQLVISHLALGLCSLFSGVFATMSLQHSARLAMNLLLFISSLTAMVCAYSLAVHVSLLSGTALWIRGLTFFACSCACINDGRMVLKSILYLCICDIVLAFIQNIILDWEPSYLLGSACIMGLLPELLTLSVFALVWIWKLLTFEEKERPRECRQTNADGLPVRNLDQLYAQAQGVDFFLRNKLRQWAVTGGAYMPVLRDEPARNADPYVRWSTVEVAAQHCQQVAWSKLMSADRAVEKVVAEYEGDVSRLLDVCRQILVFETEGDVAACLRLIKEDHDVVVYAKGATGRVRDVSVNLRIVTEQTRNLFLDHHICELRLVLKEIALMESKAMKESVPEWHSSRTPSAE